MPTSAQAKQFHDLSESGKWTTKAAKEILAPKSREKGAAAEQAQKAVVFKSERIPLMFPPGTTQSEMESHILKMLELQKLAKRKQQEEAKKPAEEKMAPPPEQGSPTVELEKAAAQKPAVSPKLHPQQKRRSQIQQENQSQDKRRKSRRKLSRPALSRLPRTPRWWLSHRPSRPSKSRRRTGRHDNGSMVAAAKGQGKWNLPSICREVPFMPVSK